AVEKEQGRAAAAVAQVDLDLGVTGLDPCVLEPLVHGHAPLLACRGSSYRLSPSEQRWYRLRATGREGRSLPRETRRDDLDLRREPTRAGRPPVSHPLPSRRRRALRSVAG